MRLLDFWDKIHVDRIRNHSMYGIIIDFIEAVLQFDENVACQLYTIIPITWRLLTLYFLH